MINNYVSSINRLKLRLEFINDIINDREEIFKIGRGKDIYWFIIGYKQFQPQHTVFHFDK